MPKLIPLAIQMVRILRMTDMTRPETPYEAASYDLNKFRERRMADRRFQARDTADRRSPPVENSSANDQSLQGTASKPNAG